MQAMAMDETMVVTEISKGKSGLTKMIDLHCDQEWSQQMFRAHMGRGEMPGVRRGECV